MPRGQGLGCFSLGFFTSKQRWKKFLHFFKKPRGLQQWCDSSTLDTQSNKVPSAGGCTSGGYPRELKAVMWNVPQSWQELGLLRAGWIKAPLWLWFFILWP